MSAAVIKDGDGVILKKGTNLKFTRVRHAKKDRMENFVVDFDSLIGQPFGSAFHVDGRTTKKIAGKDLNDDMSFGSRDESSTLPCESEKDNRSLVPDTSSQKLSHDEIREMKRVGTSGNEIVGQIVENSSTFQNKTQYSQVKYLKKKKNRHVTKFQVLKPRAELLCQMLHSKAPTKIVDLRPDSLAQLLLYSNVHSGSNVLLMETCQGLLAGAIMERLGGSGQIVQVFHCDFPVRVQLDHFDFPKEEIRDRICGCQFNDLPDLSATSLANNCRINRKEFVVNGNSSTPELVGCREAEETLPANVTKSEETVDEGIVVEPKNSGQDSCPEGLVEPIDATLNANTMSDADMPESDDVIEAAEPLSHAKRKRLQERERALGYLKHQQLDCLIMAAKLDPLNILLALLPYLLPSSPFAVYCQFKEPLMDCFVKIRQRSIASDVSLSETWCRSMQVLPSRTHPQVVMSASGGYLLTGIKVDKDLHTDFEKDIPTAQSAGEPAAKRLKTDD